MEFAIKNKDHIIGMYNRGCSSYEIAESLSTYSTKILRALKFLGKLLHDDEDYFKRDYSEAQKLALEKGRARHPTEGKKLDSIHKKKIGESRSKAYHSLSEEEKKRISEMSKANWQALGKAKQEEIRSLALESVRQASKLGSKTERHLNNGLAKLGYKVEFHKTDLVFGNTLEVDLFLPEVKTAIEIDGPGHFLPIWGPEKLIKQQIADTAKQGILINSGYVIIRIRQIDKSISLTKMNHLLDLIVREVESIKNKFPSQTKRLIEIEVKDGQTRRI
jgi:very-short-patch-repair endonuclease